jgi:hypothetical protein
VKIETRHGTRSIDGTTANPPPYKASETGLRGKAFLPEFSAGYFRGKSRPLVVPVLPPWSCLSCPLGRPGRACPMPESSYARVPLKACPPLARFLRKAPPQWPAVASFRELNDGRLPEPNCIHMFRCGGRESGTSQNEGRPCTANSLPR